MNGISKANITNATTGTGGFTGNITGLTQVTLMAASLGNVQLGTSGQGLNTALETVEIPSQSGLHSVDDGCCSRGRKRYGRHQSEWRGRRNDHGKPRCDIGDQRLRDRERQ